MVDDEETTFEMSQKQTVLEAALKQGIDAPYSCQGGICSSCLARITNGTAEMRKNSILTDGEIAEGLILTCQAHPTSPEIYVDSDDRIHGRALVWKVKKSPCESKYFMDRVYTNRDSDVNRFRDFANSEGWFYKKKMNSHVADNVLFVYKGQDVAGEVKLKLEGKFKSYPFVDTMCFLSKDKDSLSNLSDKKCYHLNSVYGEGVECEDCDGDVITTDYDGDRGLCSDCSSGHRTLKDMGIETKWNKRVD
jgi:ferredoxin